MSSVVLQAAQWPQHQEVLLELNTEYLQWVFAHTERACDLAPGHIAGMPVREYAAAQLPKVCGNVPPAGVFYLARAGTQTLGMGGLRRLTAQVAEIKRLYVRPACRGGGVATQLLQALLCHAGDWGYERVQLDSAPFMQAAQGLYARHGFVDCAPYPETEVPTALWAQWRFMQHRIQRNISLR